MIYTLRRVRLGNGSGMFKAEWFGKNRREQTVWYKTRKSAYEFIGWENARRVAQRWADEGNNWRYYIDSTAVTEIRPGNEPDRSIIG